MVQPGQVAKTVAERVEQGLKGVEGFNRGLQHGALFGEKTVDKALTNAFNKWTTEEISSLIKVQNKFAEQITTHHQIEQAAQRRKTFKKIDNGKLDKTVQRQELNKLHNIQNPLDELMKDIVATLERVAEKHPGNEKLIYSLYNKILTTRNKTACRSMIEFVGAAANKVEVLQLMASERFALGNIDYVYPAYGRLEETVRKQPVAAVKIGDWKVPLSDWRRFLERGTESNNIQIMTVNRRPQPGDPTTLSELVKKEIANLPGQ